MGSLFKQKKQEPSVSVVADPYKSVREPYLNWLSGQIGKTGPTYTGDMVAPMSPYENESLSWLDNYAKGGPSATRTAATGEINKTLSGYYADPTTSPYYQAVKAEAARNLKDVQTNIASNAGGGGNYWTGARLKLQGEEAGKSADHLNEVLGGLAEKERQNMLGVLPQAFSAAEAEEQMPLQKATALQTIGALPRNIQQSYLDAIKNEWLRSNYEYPMKMGELAAGSSQAPVYGQSGYSASPFQQITSAAAPWLNMATQAMMFQNMFGKGGNTQQQPPQQPGGYPYWLG